MDVDELLEDLRAELRRATADAEHARTTVAALAQVVDSLVQILHTRDVLADGHLELLARVRARVTALTKPGVRLDRTDDKYGVVPAEIDCAARMHLCHGRCCAYSIMLSAQDLAEGKLRWRVDEPYYLPHGDHGSCAYQDRTSGACEAYAHRPAQCRSYDCRQDARIWIDFEAGIPAPMPPGLVPLRLKPPG
ncbi:MAG: YkgJ family cysteine cluster protein [Kofleriaceae bacterium]